MAAALLVACAIALASVEFDALIQHPDLIGFGSDFVIVRDAAERWISGGPFYLPEQISGPYDWPGAWVLYPPPALVLFVPFVWLPAVLWWAIPVGIIGAIVWSWRPRPLAWAVIAFCLAYPTTISMLVWGNPGMWIVAAAALATRYPWAGPLVLLKPSLAPFAAIGIRHRSWWYGLAALGIVSLAFLPMWPDYFLSLRNAQAPVGWFGYSTAQIPAMLLPVAAWLGRSSAAR